jgi:hypothetical protein
MIKDVVIHNGLLRIATGTFVCMVGFTGQSLPDLQFAPNWSVAVRRRSFLALRGLEIKPKATGRHGLTLGRRCGAGGKATSNEKKKDGRRSLRPLCHRHWPVILHHSETGQPRLCTDGSRAGNDRWRYRTLPIGYGTTQVRFR